MQVAFRPNQHTATMPPLEAEAVIFRALADAAEAGAPCPTADDLAELIPDGSITRTVDIVKRLEQRGVIAVTRYQRGRQVRIVATGAITRPIPGGTPHWRNRPQGIPSPTVDSIRTLKPITFAEISAAANCEGRSISDFLSDLVFMGFAAYREDREMI